VWDGYLEKTPLMCAWKKMSFDSAKNAGDIGKTGGLARLHSNYGLSGKKVRARLDKERMIV
jgi:hypothetical protein